MDSFGDFRVYCQRVVNKYGSPANATEEEKAEEFCRMYLGDIAPNLTVLECVTTLRGISLHTVDGTRLPRNMRGYHDVFEGRRSIYYRKGDTVSGIENTILHEFREMVEPTFAEVCPGYEPRSDVHVAANRFAAAVLLPRKTFINKLFQTGLDVFELAAHYSKSSSQVLLRMGEVLKGKYFFYGALYECDPEQKAWSLNYRAMSPSMFDEPNVYELGDFFPTKGTPVRPGSLVDMAIKGRKPCLVRILTLLDDLSAKDKTREGFVALARPLLMSDIPTKVALVVVFGRNSNLLAPQANRLQPAIVKEFHSRLS